MFGLIIKGSHKTEECFKKYIEQLFLNFENENY